MFRSPWLGALVVLLSCSDATPTAPAGAADVGASARSKRHSPTGRAAQNKRKKGTARRKAPSEAKGRSHLPPGWTWPPSEAMRDEGRACLQDLDQLHVHWQAAPPEHAITTPVTVTDMDFGGLVLKRTRSQGSLVMDCELARALARYAAPVLRRLTVHELHVGQIKAERDRQPGELSRHSLGLAVDVYALVTADGQEHVVETGYLAGDRVLHLAELLLGGSGGFRTVMTPGNDPGPHHNHFHIDALAFGDRVVPRLVLGANTDWCSLVGAVMGGASNAGGPWWLIGLCRAVVARGG